MPSVKAIGGGNDACNTCYSDVGALPGAWRRTVFWTWLPSSAIQRFQHQRLTAHDHPDWRLTLPADWRCVEGQDVAVRPLVQQPWLSQHSSICIFRCCVSGPPEYSVRAFLRFAR
mmetsp:Transcript_36926/g.73056  ORF Transcript_36926/g.73056 Transcript_36926/m.73056 type:complete len:115 (+) Transcript_36926:140-484(+)